MNAVKNSMRDTRAQKLRIYLRSLAVALLYMTHAASAQSQTANYPTKPIRIIVPYVAGGPSDLFARAVGQLLTEAWGQPIVIDNRPGASGNVGVAAAAKAPADGYTLNTVSHRVRGRPRSRQQVRLRSGQGPGAHFTARHHQQYSRRASRAAGEVGQGTDRLRGRASRAGDIRVGRRRRRAASRGRACSPAWRT